MRSTKMSPRLQHQVAKSKEQALAAFVSRKAEIDTMLTRVQALSDEHFNYSPDEITWDHVGTLGYYADLLKRVTDSAFKEGEHAA
jgi:chaperonin cofactor prefoldin